jgi:hypothetical protein
MGIETAIAIIGIAAAAAGTGAEVYSSQQAADKSDKARKDSEAMAKRNAAQLAETQNQNDATAAARLARLRQRAFLAISGQNNDQTIATSPMGLAATQGASGGGYSAPKPLQKLGA